MDGAAGMPGIGWVACAMIFPPFRCDSGHPHSTQASELAQFLCRLALYAFLPMSHLVDRLVGPGTTGDRVVTNGKGLPAEGRGEDAAGKGAAGGALRPDPAAEVDALEGDAVEAHLVGRQGEVVDHGRGGVAAVDDVTPHDRRRH